MPTTNKHSSISNKHKRFYSILLVVAKPLIGSSSLLPSKMKQLPTKNSGSCRSHQTIWRPSSTTSTHISKHHHLSRWLMKSEILTHNPINNSTCSFPRGWIQSSTTFNTQPLVLKLVSMTLLSDQLKKG